MCIAFMYKKIGKNLKSLIELVKVIEVSLELMIRTSSSSKEL
jgi:hypothetical protein